MSVCGRLEREGKSHMCLSMSSIPAGLHFTRYQTEYRGGESREEEIGERALLKEAKRRAGGSN